jgi:hypothetical protein
VKNRDTVNLLNRAAAALETPEDLAFDDVEALIEDLTSEAARLSDTQVMCNSASPGPAGTASERADHDRRDRMGNLRMEQELIETALESIPEDSPHRAKLLERLREVDIALCDLD